VSLIARLPRIKLAIFRLRHIIEIEILFLVKGWERLFPLFFGDSANDEFPVVSVELGECILSERSVGVGEQLLVRDIEVERAGDLRELRCAGDLHKRNLPNELWIATLFLNIFKCLSNNNLRLPQAQAWWCAKNPQPVRVEGLSARSYA